MKIACLDLEGVLVPEIWVNVAERTGIAELNLTTRDIPDYDELMQRRLRILDANGIKLEDIQSVISEMSPLPGAVDFINWLRKCAQVVILSDTFYQFGMPIMRQLGYPTLLCHNLSTDQNGNIAGYHIRIDDPKKRAVKAFHDLNFQVIAAGDSYNDIAMLKEADSGILFRPPENVVNQFPEFPIAHSFEQLRLAFENAL